MASIVVRNLPDEIHRALKVRAAMHGRSTEAEIREILEQVVRPRQRLMVGTELANFGKKLAFEFDFARDKKPIRPAEFE